MTIRIGRPLPNVTVRERVAVDCLARRWPLLEWQPRRLAAPPPTQMLWSSLHDDRGTFPQPVVTRGPNVAELMEEYCKTGKVMPGHLADLLAAIDVLHEAFGEDMPSPFQSSKSTPIPGEVVTFAIATLRGEWTLGEYTAEKTKKANDAVARRDALMQRHGLSKLEAARRIITQDYPGLAETSPEFVTRRETLRKK